MQYKEKGWTASRRMPSVSAPNEGECDFYGGGIVCCVRSYGALLGWKLRTNSTSRGSLTYYDIMQQLICIMRLLVRVMYGRLTE